MIFMGPKKGDVIHLPKKNIEISSQIMKGIN